ncbi:MAG: IPT/TIG domain-containing protein, partial [Nitrospirae bacterium]|nr:IPT/TIG domain-containing protein [Nitrospirota bacterium]
MEEIHSDWITAFGVLVLTACGGGGGGAGQQGPAGPATPGRVEIQSLVANPTVVGPGESVVLSVSAEDGTGSALTYLWQAAAGSLSAVNTNPVTWTAPLTVGSVLVSVNVANGVGFIATGFASIFVSVSPPSGPIVTSSNPMEVKVGNEIRVTGTGFGNNQGSSSLMVGGVAASTIVSWSDNQIRAIVPAGALTGAVKVVAGSVESNPSNLVVLWPKENPENVAISTALNDQESPQLIADGAGGAIIAWQDFRAGATSDIYAQRVTSAGAVLWTADGVAVSTAANNQGALQFTSDGAAGAIIAWQEARSGSTSDIYAQR